MTSQRLLGMLLILCEAIALGYLSQTYVFPIAVGFAAVYGLFSPRRYRLGERESFYALAALFTFFVVKLLVAPHHLRMSEEYLLFHVAHAAAQYFLVLQVVALFWRWQQDHLPVWLPALGIIVMICVADVQVNARGRFVYQCLSLAFVACSAGYLGTSRRFLRERVDERRAGRLIVALIVLAASLAIGTVVATGLHRYQHTLDWLLAEVLQATPTGTTGFSGAGRLGSVARRKETGSADIVLRVVAEQQPEYLRGAAFDLYHQAEWHATGRSTPLPLMTRLPAGIHKPPESQRLFGTVPTGSTAWRGMEVWPEASLGGHVFAPLGTQLLQAATAEVSVNEQGIFESDDLMVDRPYSVFTPRQHQAAPLTPALRSRLMVVPGSLDPKVRALAERVFTGCKTDADKIARVQKYFHAAYEYRIGINVPAAVDPLTYFLLERPPAHCEYFASGATILLRLAGIPCRYVTGYVAAERGPWRDYWVVRNKHAHAWAEAFDESRGWVIVEATPASGVPEETSGIRPIGLWEHLRYLLRRLRVFLQDGGLQRTLRALLAWLLTLPGVLLSFLVAVALALHCYRRRRPRRPPRPSPAVQALQRLLAKMDARLRQQSYERRSGETLHQFAERLPPEPARWYRAYANLRYQPVIDEESVSRLRQTIPESP